MKRFLWGLAGGGASAGVTWLLSHDTLLTVIVGGAVAVIIWMTAWAHLIGDIFEELFAALLK